MKICLECSNSQMITIETNQGPQRVLGCTHGECRDPISGVPLPLTTARTQEAFCGIKGRFYEKKEEVPKEEKSIIQLNK